MPTLQTLLTFFATTTLLALTPGPDNVFVLMQSLQRGARAGLCVVLGLCCGLVLHTAAVALGLAAVLATSSTAFTVLKLLGAAYLTYLAWHMLRATPVGIQPAPTGPGADASAPKALRMVGRGLLMNLMNPKVLIFCLAFLPQFADPARGSVTLQITLLGGVFIVTTLLVFGAIALFSGRLGAWLQRSARAQYWLERITGVVFLGLALRLASATR